VRAEMLHQSLAVKAIPDSHGKFGVRVFKRKVVDHRREYSDSWQKFPKREYPFVFILSVR
jgi:hypothetical protein